MYILGEYGLYFVGVNDVKFCFKNLLCKDIERKTESLSGLQYS